MNIISLLILGSWFIELLLVYLEKGRFLKLLSLCLALIILGSSIALIIFSPAAWTILIAYFSLFRVINLYRLNDSKKQTDYLYTQYLRASRHLASYQLVVYLCALLYIYAKFSSWFKWDLLSLVELLASAVIFFIISRSLRKTKALKPTSYSADNDLPSLSVVIPARNETTALEDCLNSLILSDYPKLEILVLDDCSQNKHTPEIIRQYAHDGIRFLAGKIPPDAWSAKNYAYQQLSEAASGQILMFCGVDTRFERSSIRLMVELMLSRSKTMLSIIPNNVLPPGSRIDRLAIQPWRYLWELGLPRRRLIHPPVLSTCWLIKKEALAASGGFKAVSRNILPERYFARQIAGLSDGYSFIQSHNILGVSCQKDFSEQFATAVRTRYPALKQRLELTSLVALFEALIWVFPLGVLVLALLNHNLLISFLSLLSFAFLASCFFRVVKLTYSRSDYLSLLLVSILAIYDIALLLYSMWQYEFNEVVWKDRNVCIPVMHVIESLPKIN